MADDGGEVQVRLSQEGGDEVLALLQQITNQLSDLKDAAKEAGDAQQTIADSSTTTSFSTAASAAMEYADKIYQVVEQLGGYVSMLEQVEAEHEQLEIRITALNEKLEGWGAAAAQAGQDMQALIRMSSQDNLADLTTVFQRLTLMVGGTDAQILQLTQNMELFAQASGVTAEQLLRVITMAERTGTLPNRPGSQLAVQAIQGALGANAGQQIAQAAAQAAQDGGAALQGLVDKLKPTQDAIDALNASWTNTMANFDRAKTGTLAEVAVGLDGLKGDVQNLTSALNSSETQRGADAIAQQISGLVSQLNQLVMPSGAQDAVNYYSTIFKTLLELARTWVLAWTTIFQVAAEAIATAWDLLPNLLDPFSSPDTIAKVKDGLSNMVVIVKQKVDELKGIWDTPDNPLNSGGGAPGTSGFIGPPSPGPSKPATGPDLTAKLATVQTAADALQNLYDKADEKHDLAGLTGIAAQLQTVENQAENTDAAMVKAYNKWFDDLAKIGQVPSQSASDAFDATQAEVWADAAVDEITKVATAQQKFRQQAMTDDDTYYKTLTAMEKGNTQDVIQLNDEAAAAQIAQANATLDKERQLLISKYGLELDNDEKIATLEQATQDKIAAIKAIAAQKDQTLRDEQYGQWDAYYTDLMTLAAFAHTNIFVAAQASLKKVADAMTAAAQTGADGWAAGWAKIRSTIDSFGQDVEGLMTTVWGDLTKSFDTAFADVLEGKFSDLKSVFQNLWNDILSSFGKMLEQMLMRWLVTGDAMGNGQGTGGVLGSLFSGGLGALGGSGPTGSTGVKPPDGSSGNPIYTYVTNQPQQAGAGGAAGASAPGTGGYTGVGNYESQYDANAGQSSYGAGPGLASEGWTETTPGSAATATAPTTSDTSTLSYAGYAAAALQLVNVIGKIGQTTTSQPTYQGENLGVTANFGGTNDLGAWLSTAATVAVAGGFNPYAIIAAVVIAIVGVIVNLINGPQEGHVKIAIADAMDAAGATTVIGGFVDQVIGQTTDFVGALAFRAGDSVSQYTSSFQSAFQEAYGKATFDIHAGSPADLQTDVNAFFNTVLPTLAMKAAFGQTGYGFGGNSNTAGGENGGIAGTSWNANNPALMDQNGNWVKQQLYDPNAPIPMMLAGLGFTSDAINAIATKLADGEDIKTFQTYLMNLVGVVADFQALSKQLGQTWAEWQTTIQTAENQQGTAGQFSTGISNLENQGAGLDSMSSEDAVTAAQALVTSSQTMLTNLATALQSIYDMITSIQTQTTAAITTYQNKLLTSAQIEQNARNAEAGDLASITTAANPAAVQAAWKQTMTDIETVLDAIAARITAIKALQQSYADFETQMATDAGPQFGTDPTAWLAQNESQIVAMQTALKTATGDDAIKDAQTLLTLVQQRYQNEMTALANVNAAIKSIDAQSQSTIQSLTMQAMGTVTTGANGQTTFTPDYNAQGEYLQGQYTDLMKQLSSATTSDQVTEIMNQINSVINQLAAEPQDPSNYAASRTILATEMQQAQDAADKALGTMKDTLTDDLNGIGDDLKSAEAVLATQLADAQTDYTNQLALMSEASAESTVALGDFAQGIVDAMQQLDLYIAHWEFVMTNASGVQDPNWDYAKNAPKAGTTPTTPPADVWVTDPTNPALQDCIEGPDKGKTRPNPAYVPPVTGGTGGGSGGNPSNPNPEAPVPAAHVAGSGAVATTTTTPTDATADAVAKIAALATALSSGTTPTDQKLSTLLDVMASFAARQPVAVNVAVQGNSADDIADAASEIAKEAVYVQTLAMLQKSNLELVRTIKNNPSLIAPTVSSRPTG